MIDAQSALELSNILHFWWAYCYVDLSGLQAQMENYIEKVLIW